MKEFCSGVNKSGASSEGILQWSEGNWGRRVKEFCSGVNESGVSSEGTLQWSERIWGIE